MIPVAGAEHLVQQMGQYLPDFRSRTIVGLSPSDPMSAAGGQETVALGLFNLPSHTHTGLANSSGQNSTDPTGHEFAASGSNAYSSGAPDCALNPNTVSVTGSGTAHTNLQPYLAVNFIINTSGGLPAATGSSSGGSFSALGGRLLFLAFSGVVVAKHMGTDGTAISRSTFSGLFSLIGTTFGVGDGSTTFNLPNLTSRALVGSGTGTYSGATAHTLGSNYGEANHALTSSELPSHTHDFRAVSEAGNLPGPANNYVASSALFQTGAGASAMSPAFVWSIGPTSAYHENRQPFTGAAMLMAVDDVTSDYNVGEVVVGPWTSLTGFYLCDGGAKNTTTDATLFAVIGYKFGGSGSSFNLPDFRGRIPVGVGQGPGFSAYVLGDMGGVEKHALTVSEMPAHSHPILAVSGSGDSTSPFVDSLAGLANQYRASGTQVTMASATIQSTGSGTAHENRMPCTTFNFFVKF